MISPSRFVFCNNISGIIFNSNNAILHNNSTNSNNTFSSAAMYTLILDRPTQNRQKLVKSRIPALFVERV